MLLGIHGVAGVFLLRLYLELTLKYIILNARWLKDPHQNATPAEVKDIRNTHDLLWLWYAAKADCKGKIPEESWKSLDVEFVETRTGKPRCRVGCRKCDADSRAKCVSVRLHRD